MQFRQEVEQYDFDLASRPEVIAVSKSELPEAEEVRNQLANATGSDVLCFSAVTGAGLNMLMNRAYTVLQEQKETP